MKNSKYISIIFITVVICMYGCKKDNFLDTQPLNAITSADIFSDSSLTRSFLLSIYEVTPKVFFTWGSILDENTVDVTPPGSSLFTTNDWNAANSPLEWEWDQQYAAIRQANSFISDLTTSKLTSGTKARFNAEARFLRAVLYIQLYRLFGGVPIITEAQSITDVKSYLVPRNTADETVNFIIQELDSIANSLPVRWDDYNHGRAEKGAALGMLSRILIYQASQKNDKSLYQQAAVAAKSVMDLKRYSLYPDYGKMFLAKEGNDEYIFFYNFVPSSTWRGWDYYGGWNIANVPPSQGGLGADMPTLNLVDAFEMSDGLPYNKSPLYNDQDPYTNRDPRFYASIYYQGSTFKGTPLEFWLDANGNMGIDRLNNNNLTPGFFIKKGIDETIPNYSADLGGPNSQYDPFLRYADILLMYAEATNEVNGPDASVYNAINQVRERAGMPNIPAGITQDSMRQTIRDERRIEFCFESSRYYDVRRWGIARAASSGPILGAKITKNPDGSLTFGRDTLQVRTFDPKYALNPIPQSEIDKNSKLVQNPGY